jgi:uncharacterized protein (DUF1800 family)
MGNRLDYHLSRRKFLKLSLAAVALTAFTPFSDRLQSQRNQSTGSTATTVASLDNQVTPTPSPESRLYSPTTLLAANRLTFGAQQADLDWIEANGVDAFIEEQLAFEQIDDSQLKQRLQGFSTLAQLPGSPLPSANVNVLLELQQGTTLRAVYSQRQLYELMVDFWTNHFNIDNPLGGADILKTVDDRDVIRRFAMGNFRDLLGASAHSPAMLLFLDNTVNLKGMPNENYARELMELHTIGVNGGFTEKDVVEVARAFTGWTVADKKNDKPVVGSFEFLLSSHDEDPKDILGHHLTPYLGANDGERVLDILANLPACAEFISTRLARWFISDSPSASVIQQGAAAFQKSQGNIRATLGAILHSQEFKYSSGLKMKRPFEYVASALRVLNAESDAGVPIQSYISRIGQPLFSWSLAGGYPDSAAAWVTTGGLLARWNFAQALSANALNGTRVDLKELTSQSGNVVAGLSQAILGRPLPPGMADVVNSIPDPKRFPEAAAFLLASPQFQVRG